MGVLCKYTLIALSFKYRKLFRSNFTNLRNLHAVNLGNLIKVILAVPLLLYFLQLPLPLLLLPGHPRSSLIQALHAGRRTILLRFIGSLMTLVTVIVSFMVVHSSGSQFIATSPNLTLDTSPMERFPISCKDLFRWIDCL